MGSIVSGAPPDPVDWYRRCLGARPARCAPAPCIERSAAVGRWTGQWLRFRGEPDEWVHAVLVKPRGVARPPVVICHHGYGCCKEQGLFGAHWSARPFAQEPEAALSDHGLAVLALDARCHGARLGPEAPDPVRNPDAWRDHFETAWQWLARRCLVDGRSLQGLLVHDVQCAIDYLTTRDDVDARRLGMYGYSMGGTTCWSCAVVEPRIRVAAVGGCLIDYETALRVHRDASWHAWVPGVRLHASREALVSAIAPRPLLAVHGDADFPPEGVEPILAAARRAYADAGRPDHFRSIFLPGDHTAAARDPRLIEQVGEWFARHL